MMLSDCELEWIWGYKHARRGGGGRGKFRGNICCMCMCECCAEMKARHRTNICSFFRSGPIVATFKTK